MACMNNRMKIVNTVDVRTPIVCKVQGEIFCEANRLGYDMEDFTKKYLTSNFCANCMDTLWSVYQIWWPIESIYELQEEVTIKETPLCLTCIDAIFWIGYMYRMMYYLYGINSKQLFYRLPFRKMLAYFDSLHTMSYEQACATILENDFSEFMESTRILLFLKLGEEIK